MKNLILFITICCSLSGLCGQENAYQLFVRKTAESHQLRWFPADYAAWATGLEQGYRLERSTDGQNFAPLHTTPIRPSFSAAHEADQLLRHVLQFQDSLLVLAQQDDRSRKVVNSLPREFQKLIAIATNGIEESGLFFADESARAEQQYWYRLKLGGGRLLATVRPSDIKAPASLPPLAASQQGESIVLQWLQKRTPANFQAFQLERQSANKQFAVVGANWRFPRAYPAEWNIQIDTFQHIDTIAVIGEKYTYRLRAVDAFGTVLEGSLTPIVTKDLIPPASANELTTKVDRKASTVALQWEYPVVDPDLHAFAVYRSQDPQKDFQQIHQQLLPVRQRAFQDQITGASGNYYYKIAALDASGNIGWSLRASAYFPDKIPPSIPGGLIAQYDTLGQVSISWQASPEADTKGYFLSRGRFLNDKFVALSANAATETTFTDTVPLHFVNREIFYKVAAADQYGNVSAYSEPVRLLLPDTIAPVAPVLRPIAYTNGEVQLSWQAGNEEDLRTIKVFRKDSEEGRWRLIKSIASNNTKTADNELDSVAGYWQYRVQAVDEQGNHSQFSNERVVRISTPATTVNPVQRLAGDYRPKVGGIVLEWAHLTKASVRYLVFRQDKATEEPILLAQINTTRFFDAEVMPGQQYNYFIIVQDSAGSYSASSERVAISTQ